MSDTNLLQEIRNSTKKPKELLQYLANLIVQNPFLLNEFDESIESANNDVEKGTLVESLEYVSKEHPELVIPQLPLIIECLKSNAPRVKWESSRVIANVAKDFPKEATKAVKHLLFNTKDKSTVVRWSTALALGEILKSSQSNRASLQQEIEALIAKEQNNGVKNVYIKAIKCLK